MTTSKRTVDKAAAILLTVVTLFLCLAPYVAADDKGCSTDEPYPLRFTYIKTYNCDLSISGITAACSAAVKTISACYISMTMELQKQKSVGYETVKSWSDSTTGTSLSMSETRTINVFSTYRLKVSITAGSDSTVIYDY